MRLAQTRYRLGWATAALCLTLGHAAEDHVAPAKPQDDALGMGLSGGELTLFEDLPVVVSGSRRESLLLDSPVPISVIHSMDIHYGGYVHLADILQFQPGIDVAYVDRNHPMIGIRGFHEVFSDRTLTLVDGIVADNPIYGGNQFQRLPITMLDIDRVEIIRGPGSAAWGANAFNGAINIITKKADDPLATHVSAGTNSSGDYDAEARWSKFYGPVTYRFSVGYSWINDSQDALNDDDSSSTDWSETAIIGAGLDYHWTPTTTVVLNLGTSYVEQGELVLLNLPSNANTSEKTVRGDITFNQIVSDNASLSLRTYGNYYQTDDPNLIESDAIEQGSTLQIDLTDLGPHTVTTGVDLRYTHISSTDIPNRFSLTDNPTNEYRVGIFAIDHWQLHERMTLESQGRIDTYSGTGTDWAGRLALITIVDEATSQRVRCAVARAYRTPLISLRGVDLESAFVGSTPLITYTTTDDLENEHTAALELGWSGSFWEDGSLRIDTYYQGYSDLIGYTITPSSTGLPAPADTAIDVQPQTLSDGISYGFESELAQTLPAGRFSLWFAWNHFETDPPDVNIRAYEPASYKVGCTSRWSLPWDLIGVVNYRYASATKAPSTDSMIAANHRLDLACTWLWKPHRIDVTFGVHDVLDQTTRGTGLFTPDNGPMPGRTFFLRGSGTF